MKEGNRGTRLPTGAFGGRVASGARVTQALVAINVALYLVEWIYPRIVDYLEMVGAAYDPNIHQLIGVANGQYYRLLTNTFLHEPGLIGFGPAHIIFNMWALIIVGPGLERLLGPLRFTAIYLFSALGGSVLYYLLVPVNEPALGASGAIFGLFGAWFVVARRTHVDARSIVFLIVINLALGFALPSIAWQAHVGGLVTGGLLTAAFVYAPKRYRTQIQLTTSVVMLALLVVAAIVKTHTIT